MANNDNTYIAEIANFVFDDRITAAEVNDHVADVASSAFHTAIEASKSLDRVPKPTGHRPGVVWLVSEGVRMFWRIAGRQKVADMGRATAKVKWRSAYETAKKTA